MDNSLTERIAQAVTQGVEARRQYYSAIALDDEQELGPPVDLRSLILLEAQLKRSLPPSYRAFLELHDGWKMVDGGVDLLPVRELLHGPRHQEIIAWQKEAQAAGDDVAARSLVIGISDITPTKYLLDPVVVDQDGEWRLVQHHKVEEAEVPSFLQWLEESVAEYLELAQTERDAPTDE